MPDQFYDMLGPLAIGVGFVIAVLGIILSFRENKRRENLRDEQVENNTYIRGKCINWERNSHRGDRDKKDTYIGTYEYELNGKRKKYRIVTFDRRLPKESIKLIYDPKKKKVFTLWEDFMNGALAKSVIFGMVAGFGLAGIFSCMLG